MEEDRSSKFSPSKLDVYKNCARRYQYRYVDKISRRRKTPETVVGVAVHAAFEELYGLVSGGKVPALAEVQAFYERALGEEWDETVQLKDARFTREDWTKVGRDCVELYYGAHAPFSEDRTVAVEKRVGFPLEVEGREYRIEGFVDRLSLAPDGAFEIHDYKTAKSLPNQEHADADWQLALYELAVRREWPDTKEVRLKWHYVRHGKILTSVRDAAARERLLADVAKTIAAIKHDHEFAPNETALCDWCEYRDLCPVFAHPLKVAALPAEERKRDDGVKLVDALAEVEAKRRKVKDELKTLDLEKKDLDDRIAAFAEAAGVTTVAGGAADATVAIKDEVHLPTKTHEPERHEALERDARKTPELWSEVARLDGHALVEGVRARRWAGALFAAAESLLERYGRREPSRAVRLKKRRAADEE
ncbi:MAG TPA: PD-(D/E)XK nuclease family protein [Elusimicrobiota bacterium]|nr:PD-(D/E)XK nuclease family protein [Elusimicrobiota bacterium]